MFSKGYFGLTAEDLRKVAQQCVMRSATVDLDAFPFGSGRVRASRHRSRRGRFNAAIEILESSDPKPTLTVDVYPTTEDLEWATGECTDPELKERFIVATEASRPK